MKPNKKKQIWGEHLEQKPDEANVLFCAGRDVSSIPMADLALVPYDIWTNLAHAKMLYHVQILTLEEWQQLEIGLLELIELYKKGEFKLDSSKEDVHINVESFLSDQKNIDAAKKLHTGRSRNDQVATDMRLFMRDQMLHFSNNLFLLISEILQLTKQHTESYMPGFTHYQPAMWTTFAHWLTNWSQGLLRSYKRMLHDVQMLNISPLGAAASFGTSWKIDREYVANLLGFDGVQENTLDCISSRWEYEAQLASTFSLLMNQLSVISQDLILLSSPYYGMVQLSDQFVTGSSIMPQKRNPDFAELIKAKTAISHGILQSILGIQKGAMSGYNRDTQPTKYLIMDLFQETIQVPLILSGVIKTLKVSQQNMLEKCNIGFMNSADIADWLARKFSLSFRDCYNILALAVKYSEKEQTLTSNSLNKALQEKNFEFQISREEIEQLNSPSAVLNSKQHLGSPSKNSVFKMIFHQQETLQQIEKDFKNIQKKADVAYQNFFNHKR